MKPGGTAQNPPGADTVRECSVGITGRRWIHYGGKRGWKSKGQFLSNAICPSNGADIKGPTANANSVGFVLGGKAKDGQGGLGRLLK